MNSNNFIIRIRHAKGMTRLVLNNKSNTTVKEVKELIFKQIADNPNISTQQLTMNGKSTDKPLSNESTLLSLNINHGDILYLKLITSAIICQSQNNNNNRRNRKRKLNDTDIINTSNQPAAKRIKRHHSNNNNNNNSSSLVVHTLSNTNTPNASNNNPISSQTQRRRSSSLISSNKTSTLTATLKKKLATKTKQKKKKKKKKKEEFLIILNEGNNINDITDNYLKNIDDNILNNILNELPNDLKNNYDPAQRIYAIKDEKVSITEYLEKSMFSSKAKSRGKLYLIVDYSSSSKRKKRRETVCFYNDEEIGKIITNILWNSIDQDENKRNNFFIKTKINNKNILNIINKSKLEYKDMSQRSPPLLWSIFHSFPNQQWTDILVKFVKVSMKELRIRASTNQNDQLTCT